MNLFNLENKFLQSLSKITDCMILSVLWLIASLPIVTIGASTTALYYTVNKVFYNDRGNNWSEFWNAFAQNFKQSTIMWSILLVLYGFLVWDAFILFQLAKTGNPMGQLYYLILLLIVLLAMWSGYWFPYVARFSAPTTVVLKNSVYIAIFHFMRTILLFLLLVLTVAGFFVMPFYIIFLPALYMIFANKILEKIFEKYMTTEDLEKERQRNGKEASFHRSD